MIVLNASDLAATQTARAANLDALGAGAHGAGHGVLHGAAVRDTLLQLLGDVLSHQLSVHIGVADFHDVQLDLLADHLFHSQTILLDLLATLANDNTGTGAVQIDGNDVVAALDLDLGNAGTVQSLLEILADLLILDDQVADLLFTGIPTGIPVFDDADPQAMGINFLSHKLSPPFLMPFPSQPG